MTWWMVSIVVTGIWVITAFVAWAMVRAGANEDKKMGR